MRQPKIETLHVSDEDLARADDDGFAIPEKNYTTDKERTLLRRFLRYLSTLLMLLTKRESMKKETQVLTKAGRDYAVAYEAHYMTKNSKEAFELYRGVMAAYPESQEAVYSKKQIENIVASLVPTQQLFDAQVKMVLARFE